MILIDDSYSEYTGEKTDEYPGGCAVDATTDDGFDGTEYKARWHNDVIGAMHAVFVAAFGDINLVTNESDNVMDSDFLRALRQLIKEAADLAKVLRNVNAAETIFIWEDLDIIWSATKHYAAFADFAGKYKDYLPIKAWAENDGIHIYIRRFDGDGNVVEGTPAIKWNQKKWNSGFKWGQSDFVPVNIIVKEVFVE